MNTPTPMPGTAEVWTERSAETGCDEKLVYEIGKKVADSCAYKAGSDNHTRVWLAAQMGAREAMRRSNEAALLSALEGMLSALGNVTVPPGHSLLSAAAVARAAIASAQP